MTARKRTLDEDEEDYQNELRQAELDDIQAGRIKKGRFVDDGQGGEDSQEDAPEVVTKSGRVRKKSTKVIEMEEAEELERVTAKQPRAAPKTPKRPKKVGEVATPATGATSRPAAAGAPITPRSQPAMSKADAGLESLKLKLSAITADTVKKGKAKKAPAIPALAVSPPPAAAPPAAAAATVVVAAPSSPIKTPITVVTEQPPEAILKQEVDGSKLKMLLSPKKDKLPPAPTLSATMSALAAHLTTPSFIPTLTPQDQPTPAKTPKKKAKKEPAVKKEVPLKDEPLDSLSGTELLSDSALDVSDSSPHPHMDSFDSASDLDVDSELIIADPPAAEKKSPKKKSPKGKGKALTVAAALAAESAIPRVQVGAERGAEEQAVVIVGDDVPAYANTQEMAMKLMTSAEKKASKGKKGKKGKKEEDPEKPKKKRAPTAYMLWCNSYRPRVVAENPGIDFAAISRRLGEIWQSLPDKEKMSWKRKAKKAANKGSTLISTGKTTAGKAASVPSTAAAKPPPAAKTETSAAAAKPAASVTPAPAAAVSAAQSQFTSDVSTIPAPGSPSYKVPGTAPVDAAAHLKLLGESLSIIGARLQEHRGQIAVQGSLSVLLDSLLCALGPLSCLTSVIPELNGCPPETHANTLDNIAYFMPGIG